MGNQLIGSNHLILYLFFGVLGVEDRLGIGKDDNAAIKVIKRLI